jgi:hypothetical protein
LVKLFEEATDTEFNAIGPGHMAVVGEPSREAIRLIFSQHGFSMTEFDWTPLLGGVDLTEYDEGRRSTFILSR